MVAYKRGAHCFLPEEIEWYDKLLATGLEDTWRKLNPDSTKCSWFDYRSRGFDLKRLNGIKNF